MSDQLERYGSEEVARKVCGKIRAQSYARRRSNPAVASMNTMPPHFQAGNGQLFTMGAAPSFQTGNGQRFQMGGTAMSAVGTGWGYPYPPFYAMPRTDNPGVYLRNPNPGVFVRQSNPGVFVRKPNPNNGTKLIVASAIMIVALVAVGELARQATGAAA